MFRWMKAVVSRLGPRTKKKAIDGSQQAFARSMHRLRELEARTASQGQLREAEMLSRRIVESLYEETVSEAGNASCAEAIRVLEPFVARGRALLGDALAKLRELAGTGQEDATDARMLAEQALAKVQCARTAALADALRDIRLYPEAYFGTCSERVERELTTRTTELQRLQQILSAYEQARELEVRLENLASAQHRLGGDLATANRPWSARDGSMRRRIERAIVELDHGNQCARNLLDLGKYARRLFALIDTNRKAAVGFFGVGIAVPATLVKQVVASLAVGRDLSAADVFAKLDPTDAFKITLVALCLAAGFSAILVAFHNSRKRALRTIMGGRAGSRVPMSGLRTLHVSVAAAMTAAAMIWCGMAFAYWHGSLHLPLASASAAGEACSGRACAIADIAARGLEPVTTFGNLRVFRCRITYCEFGSIGFANGETVVLPAERIVIDFGSEIATEATMPAPASRVADAHVHVDGTVRLEGSGWEPPALRLDQRSIDSLVGAIRRIKAPKVSVDESNLLASMDRSLAEIAGDERQQPDLLKQVVAEQKNSGLYARNVSAVIRDVERCAEQRRRRNGLLSARVHAFGDDTTCTLYVPPE